MKIMYISSACSNNEFKHMQTFYKQNDSENIYGMPEASTKFHNLIIEGLSLNKCEVNSLIGRPVSYKTHKKVFWKAVKEQKDGILYNHVSFINIPILKQISIFIMVFINLLLWIIQNRKNERVILFDGAYVTLLPAISLLSFLFRIPKIAIICDVYGYMANVIDARGKRNFIHHIISKTIYGFMINMDAYIFLTKEMSNLINKKNKPFIVMEGIVDVNFKLEKRKNNNSKKIIMYAGALRREYGVANLVEGFLKWDDEDSQLWLFGTGNYVDELNEIIKKDKRVKYFGILDNITITKYEQKATLLINPRPVDGEFVRYSFPSKNLEYMLSGTPLLTTPLPAMPKNYNDKVFILKKVNADYIAKKIDEICNKSPNELSDIGTKASSFIKDNKNNVKQSKRIINLAKKVCSCISVIPKEEVVEIASLLLLSLISIFPRFSNRYVYLLSMLFWLISVIKSGKLKDFILKNKVLLGIIILYFLNYFINYLLGRANLLPYYIFNYIRIVSILFMGVFYSSNYKKISNYMHKLFTYFIFIIIFVVNIITFFANLHNYNLSRILSTGKLPNINLFGIGDYVYIYGLIFLFFVLAVYYITRLNRNTKNISILLILFTSFICIIKAEFMFSFLLLFMMVLLYVFKIYNLKKLFVFLFASFLLLFIFSKPLSNLFKNLSNIFETPNIQMRLNDFAEFFDGNIDNTIDLRLRLENYYTSVDSFKENPLFGVGFNGTIDRINNVGKHSTILDEYAEYGLFGSLLLMLYVYSFVMVWKNISSKKFQNIYFCCIAVYLVFMLINTALYVTPLFLIFIVVPLLLNLFGGLDENFVDC